MVLGEKWQNLVELVEGAGPAVNEHERQNFLIRSVWRAHVKEVHVQPYAVRKILFLFIFASEHIRFNHGEAVYLLFWF